MIFPLTGVDRSRDVVGLLFRLLTLMNPLISLASLVLLFASLRSRRRGLHGRGGNRQPPLGTAARVALWPSLYARLSSGATTE